MRRDISKMVMCVLPHCEDETRIKEMSFVCENWVLRQIDKMKIATYRYTKRIIGGHCVEELQRIDFLSLQKR